MKYDEADQSHALDFTKIEGRIERYTGIRPIEFLAGALIAAGLLLGAGVVTWLASIRL